MLYVGVIGSGRADVPSALIAAAEQVGRALAAAETVVVCGGLGGVMEAVSRGVAEAGGACVGLLPGEDRREANASLSLALPTGLGEARNALIVRASDVLIAIGGGLGMLSEIALALGGGKHVVAIDTWTLTDSHPHMHTASGASDAVRRALELARAAAD